MLAAHEGPDGDALGSLVGMQGLLTALGKDSVMFIAPDDLPLPNEYRIFELDDLIEAPPADPSGPWCSSTAATSIVTRRGSADDGRDLLNVDHHHGQHPLRDADYVVP